MKKIVSLLLSAVMLVSVIFSTGIYAFAGNSYNSDYRKWSQGKSAYDDIKNYGCYVVASAKMIREAGIKTSGFDPDVLYNWYLKNGYLKNMYLQDYAAPVYYAKAQNNTGLTYKGKTTSNIIDKIKSNAKSGYFSIIEVNNGHHYFLADNKTTNSKGSVYIYDSWNSQNEPPYPMSISSTAHGSGVYTNRLVAVYTYAYTNPKVTITFNANGGTVKGSSSLSLNKGGTLGSSIPSAIKNYSAFDGWYTAKTGGTKIQTSSTFSANTTLYAHWIDVNSSGLGFASSQNRTSGIYRIKNVKSGKYLTSQSLNNKALIKQESLSNKKSQLWYISACKDSTGTYYRLKSCYAYNNRYLDMTGGAVALSTQLQIYDDSTSNNQKWQIVDRGGKYTIHSVTSGRVVDIYGGNTDDGAVVQSYYFNNTDAQYFQFEEVETRDVAYYDNISNSYLTSLADENASSVYSSRDTSAVKVSVDTQNNQLIINALTAGQSGKDMQFSTSVNGSSTCDSYLLDGSTKVLIFTAKSSVDGAKINIRWGYDSTTEPCAVVTLSNEWKTYQISLPRTVNSGSNLHPWIDRACTVQMKDIALVDDINNYSNVIDSNCQRVSYNVTESETISGSEIKPLNVMEDCHFLGWYTKRVGGQLVSESNKLNIAPGLTKLYAHWEKHTWDSGVKQADGSIIYTCSVCQETKTDKPSHTHTYGEWVYNNDAQYVSSSDYKNGTATRTCTECGESETKEVEGTGLLRANSASVTLGAAVVLNMAIDVSRQEPFENVCFEVEYAGQTYKVDDIDSERTTDTRTYFDFDKISPEKFGDEVVITPVGVTSDGIVCKGHSVNYSVKKYCYTTLNKWGISQNLKKLLVELLYYGEAYQQYRGYKHDNLVTSELTSEQKALHTVEVPDYTKLTDPKCELNPNGEENNEVTFKSVSMLLEGKVIPKVKFEIPTTASIEDYTFTWSVNGKETSFTYAEHPEWFTKTSNTVYYVDCQILKANQFSIPFYLTVSKNGKQVSNKLRYSVESYATSTAVANNSKLKTLVDQILRYGRADINYMNGTN